MCKCQLLKLNVKRRGLTLLEIVVGIGLAALILGALYGVFATSYRSYSVSVNKAELNQNARIALERLSRDLRQTPRVVTTLPPNDTDPLNPPPSTLMFQDGHNTSKIQYITYLLSDGNLYRKTTHYYFSSDTTTWVAWNSQDQFGDLPTEAIDDDAVKADKITSLKFWGDQRVITSEIVASNGTSTYTYRTQTFGRNIQ